MPHYRKICGKKCYLSPIQPEDAAAWAAWMNDLEVSLPLGDEAYTTIALEKMQQDAAEAIQRQEPVFSIIEAESDRLIGRCLLFGIDLVNRSAMLGIVIGEKDCWNQGIGSEATCLLLDYAFNLLNLHSVMLGVFSFNVRAQRAYQKIGFQVIGRRREARLLAGKAYDVVLMDILEDEFRQRWGTRIGGLP